MFRDLILKNRSRRRFYQETAIEVETLKELVDLARLSASAANVQPLKYFLSCDPEKNGLIFRNIGLAGNPPEGEWPSAYIIVLGDRDIRPSFGCDHGIAVQSIMLGATEKGLGGCIIGAINRDRLRESLSIPSRYEILLVLALGKPKDKTVIDPVGEDGNVRGWWDDEGVRHVPKRSLDDIIIS
ncbi:MAG: nitroreductase family protein [Dehalococcoidales bacterium]|nr:MAG: nitroreductase family protein [Dehalococcoidales bacterium]